MENMWLIIIILTSILINILLIIYIIHLKSTADKMLSILEVYSENDKFVNDVVYFLIKSGFAEDVNSLNNIVKNINTIKSLKEKL